MAPKDGHGLEDSFTRAVLGFDLFARERAAAKHKQVQGGYTGQ
jgi:hypothetical protein